jgi:WD40 repeat protein
MSSNGEWFAVGGNDSNVYLFGTETMIQTQNPTGSYALDTGGSVYGVAISADGSYLSALGNSGDAGAVYALQNNDGALDLLWKQLTLRNPNYTTMDAAGNYISVADGHPDGTPGHFYLFDRAGGNQLWVYDTDNMCWAMQVSADASGIVAGGDNGTVYYFTPQ